MGCDIHFYIETKKAGRWAFHDWRKPFETGKDSDGDTDYDYGKMFDSPLSVGRNYDLFAILADVRNGRGFAGVRTGAGFDPISPPKGVPDDASPEYLKESEEYGDDGHSHSYLTLAEIEAFDWQQKTIHEGWVDPWNFETWRKRGKPSNWCGGISGGLIEHVSNRRMADLIDSGDLQWEGPEPESTYQERPYSTGLQREMRTWPLPTGSVGHSIANNPCRHYTLVEWTETYASSCKEFLTKTLPNLKALGSPDDVRIVFFFDN